MMPIRLKGLLSACLAWALLVSLTACASMRATPIWVEREIEASNEQVLWEYALSALESQGFPYGSGANPGKLEIISNWKKDLQAFKGKGNRKRATLRFERLGGGRYSLAARVEVEINQDITKPLDPTFAQWEVGPDDQAGANILVISIVARTGVPLEIAPAEGADGMESWESVVVKAASQRELTEDINRSLLALGYPLRKQPGPDRRLIQSNWNVELSSSIGEGLRQRATLRIQLLGSGRFRIRAKVDRQRNRDRQNPLDEASAQWVPLSEDLELTRTLLHAIEARSAK